MNANLRKSNALYHSLRSGTGHANLRECLFALIRVRFATIRVRQSICLFLSAICYLLFAQSSVCDTIYTNDGKELKGIIVEDYRDRVIFSTADGEKTIMKGDIKELYFDGEEDNLIKLAEQAYERKDYTKSYAYYDQALKVNPDSKKARDGVVFLQGFLFRKDQAEKESIVARQQELENGYVPQIREEKSPAEDLREAQEKAKKTIGITLMRYHGSPRVNDVLPRSAAQEAGMRRGDLIVSIWGKLTGYMSLKDFLDLLLEKPSLEMKMTVERYIGIRRGALGAKLKMEFDGLTVTEVTDTGSGLKKDDVITAIDGKTIRYTPINKALAMIQKSGHTMTKLTVRRELLIWRKDWTQDAR